MNDLRTSGKKGSAGGSQIGRRFVVYLLLVALVPILLGGYLAFGKVKRVVEDLALENLTTKSHSLSRQLEANLRERKSDSVAMSRLPQLAAGMRLLTGVEEDAETEVDSHRLEALRNTLVHYRDAYGYADILMVSTEGEILFSVGQGPDVGMNLKALDQGDSALRQVFERARMILEPQVSDYRIYKATGEPALFVAAPLLDLTGRELGVLVLRLSNAQIQQLIQDYRGLGASGEVVIATEIDGRAVTVTPLRHRPEAAFQLSESMEADDPNPVQAALLGRSSQGRYTDYRGKPVLAVGTYLPAPRWALVIKMDEEEIFAESINLRNLGTAIAGVLLAFVGCSAYFFLRTIDRRVTRPLSVLTASAGRIAEGDLSHDLEVVSADEVGLLAAAFNRMVKNVRNAQAESTKSYALLEEENQRKADLEGLYEATEGVLDPESFAAAALDCLAPRLGARVGTFYEVCPDNTLVRIGSFALSAGSAPPETLALGEGLVGQAVRDGKVQHVTDVPEDYLAVSSSLGQRSPGQLMVVPVSFEDEAIGVIELGTLGSFSPEQINLVELAARSLGVGLHTARTRRKTEALLNKSQDQEQELRQQQEEMRVINEALQSQTTSLEESSEELKNQQEELQVTNQELEEQQEALELARLAEEKKSEELARASQYKSEFLANMSHELRTPLNSLLILSKILSDNKEDHLSAKEKRYAETIHNSGSDLLTLINDLLDLSKVEAGHLEAHWADFALTALKASLHRSFDHLAEEKGVAFDIQMEAGLPETIYTDGQRLEQIIRNLLSNAFKFTLSGQVALSVHRPSRSTVPPNYSEELESTIAFAVSDTGLGIPADKRESIFDSFQQVDGSISREFGGTGLGLSISREFAHLLHGHVFLESEEGKGSTFTLILPERPEVSSNGDAATAESPSQPPPRAASRSGGTGNPSVGDDIQQKLLIVEDDADCADILSQMSRERGYDPIVVADGAEGLQAARQHRPCAIMLDICLPSMDGYAVLEGLREHPDTRDIPVHLMSAMEEPPQAGEQPVVGYLSKPISSEQLDGAFEKIAGILSSAVKKLLIVENDTAQSQGIIELMGTEAGDIDIQAVPSAEEALKRLERDSFDCVILDLDLAGPMTGFDLLKQLESQPLLSHPPVIVYTGRDLNAEEEERLQRYAQSIIIKGARSPERLIDEASLFMHRIESGLPERQPDMLKLLQQQDSSISGKTVLLVDDDIRNIFALSSALEGYGMEIITGSTGVEALERLEEHSEINIVLMDIMMPEMDGIETMRRIRDQQKYEKLPIIALTAKAMKQDEKDCREAGASDYLPKPVEVDRLVSLMRVWLHGAPTP